jgi:hypothetical protein
MAGTTEPSEDATRQARANVRTQVTNQILGEGFKGLGATGVIAGKFTVRGSPSAGYTYLPWLMPFRPFRLMSVQPDHALMRQGFDALQRITPAIGVNEYCERFPEWEVAMFQAPFHW